jgi:hypothetical protein
VIKTFLALTLSLLASFASANPVTIDPEGLAEGTDLTTAYSGVTLRHHTFVTGTTGSGLVTNNVYVKACATPSDPNSVCSALGSGLFGYQTPSGTISSSFIAEGSPSIDCLIKNNPHCKLSPHHLLDVTFDFAVQAVSIDAVHISDWPWAWAFDAAGNQLKVNFQHTWHRQCGAGNPSSNFCHQTLTVTPVTGQISRIIFSGGGGYVRLDKITYTVP